MAPIGARRSGQRPGLVLAVVLLVLLLVQLAVEPELARSLPLVAASVLACLLAGASRPVPLVAAGGMGVLTVALEVGGYRVTEAPFAVFLAVLTIAFHSGERLERVRSVGALAILVAAEVFVAVAAGVSPVGEWAAAIVANVAFWAVGVATRRVRSRADLLAVNLGAAERDAREREREAVELERARIARELHDVIAHSVAVMTVQAGAAESALDGDVTRARDAVRAIQETGRRTVEDLRHLLGVLRETPDDDSAPQPGLHRLEDLADQVEVAGLPVRLDVRGRRVPLSPGLDMAAYRIVQEALTNALRHGDASGADVLVEYTPSALRLVIENPTTPRSGDVHPGYGLTGMRERAAVFGGELQFVTTADGAFRVSAHLPLNGARS